MASLSDPRARPHDPLNAVMSIVGTLAVATALILVLSAHMLSTAATERPTTFVAFLAVSVGLQFLSIPVYGRGSAGVAGIGMLGAAFVLGPGPAVAIAAVTAFSQWLRRRGPFHRALFDAGNFGVSTAAAAWLYRVLDGAHHGAAVQLAIGTAAGLLWTVVNVSLLCLVMSQAESMPFVDVWKERFRWALGYFAAFGPIAVAVAIAYERVGWPGLVAFTLPPAVLVFSIRLYVRRTEESVIELRELREELYRAGVERTDRKADLATVSHVAAELAARAHDLGEVVEYGEYALSMLAGSPVRIVLGEVDGIPLYTGRTQVGALRLVGHATLDDTRWERLREPLLPQLALAIRCASEGVLQSAPDCDGATALPLRPDR